MVWPAPVVFKINRWEDMVAEEVAKFTGSRWFFGIGSRIYGLVDLAQNR